ncbi:MAG: cyclic pyranopterin monophosphate synthase MoaC [Pseudomonadota bacterium]
MGSDKLTHFDADGRAAMVDVSDKPETARRALARGGVRMAAETLALIRAADIKKGDVVSIAELAGVMGAKRTADLIPLCHPLPLSSIRLRIEPDDALPGLRVEAVAKTSGQTGVEMEALTAVSVACLTIYDMAKAVDRTMEITDIGLWEKDGGKSGAWRRDGDAGSVSDADGDGQS